MIEIRELSKRYGDTEALRGISTTIDRGEVVGLLGPNGAGKTTTMKIVVGYLTPTGGTARVGGVDVTDRPIEVQRRIGYLPENAPIYTDMLVQDYLAFVADVRGLERGAARRAIAKASAECGIERALTRPIAHLSKGYRQRVGLAASILHDPEILILDEPTTGLDPNQIVEIRDLIRRMGERKTVVLSTHILPEVEASCGRAVILIDGRIRADGDIDALTRSHVQVVTVDAEDPAAAAALFESLPGVAGLEPSPIDRPSADGFRTYRLRLSDGSNDAVVIAVADAARERGWRLSELKRDDRTLEQVFRDLTEHAAGEEVPA